VSAPKRERNGRTYLTPEEYTRLLSLAGSNPRDYAILQVFLQTGIRVSELCSLTLSDVDLADRTVTIRQGKGMADRTIELEKKGLQALRNYLQTRPRVSLMPCFSTIRENRSQSAVCRSFCPST
jgi:integrase